MKTILLAMVLALATVPAHAQGLPEAMAGFWQPHPDPVGTIWHMHRLDKDEYEWIVKADMWQEWDGTCKIHDTKQLGDADYEVWASCAIYADKDLKQITDDPSWEVHYQFSLCGASLTVIDLKEGQPNLEAGCKIS